MTIHAYLTARGLSTTQRPKRTPADQVIDEIAELAVGSRDAEKLLRTIAFQLREGGRVVNVGLSENLERNAAVVVARRLRNIGVLATYNQSQRANGKSCLFVRIATDKTSADVRSELARLMEAGRWLELGAAEIIRSAAARHDIDVAVASQVTITAVDGTKRELDAVAVFDDSAMVVECKAGAVDGAHAGRFASTAALLGIAKERALMLAPAIDPVDAADMATFHPVTIVDSARFLEHVDEVLVCWASGRRPAPPVEPEPSLPPALRLVRSHVAPQPTTATAADEHDDGRLLRRLFGRR